MPWFSSTEHNRWLSKQLNALLERGRAAQVPSGFGYIGLDGEVDRTKPAQLYITARMTHVYSLGTLLGIPGCRRYCDHGVRALTKYFQDHEYGGWFEAIELDLAADGKAVPAPGGEVKSGYAHAFVLLAAASATAANRPGAHELFEAAKKIQDKYFWESEFGRVKESFDRTFTKTEDYRGINANMHTVEAYLAAADVSGDMRWLDRALSIIEFVKDEAQKRAWRIAEHYDASWNVLLDYNRDVPDHPFRPFGATPGHGMEWSRLFLHAWAALRAAGRQAPHWLVEGAEELFERARVDAWRKDGAPGFVYTTDFDGKPVVRTRMHWVVCEGIQAAVALRRAELDENPDSPDWAAVERYEHCYRSWMDYSEEFLIRADGSWNHELDQENKLALTVWDGRPDVYHALGAMMAQRLPLSPCAAAALHHQLLDHPEGFVGKPNGKKKFLFW